MIFLHADDLLTHTFCKIFTTTTSATPEFGDQVPVKDMWDTAHVGFGHVSHLYFGTTLRLVLINKPYMKTRYIKTQIVTPSLFTLLSFFVGFILGLLCDLLVLLWFK